jgi:hypothetical protein
MRMITSNSQPLPATRISTAEYICLAHKFFSTADTDYLQQQGGHRTLLIMDQRMYVRY